MVLDIKTRFVVPSEKAIKVLISDWYEEYLIFTSFVEKILKDGVDQLCCGCYEEGYVIVFKQVRMMRNG